MNDAHAGIREVQGPIETEHDNSQQDRHNDPVHWLDGGHATAE